MSTRENIRLIARAPLLSKFANYTKGPGDHRRSHST